MDSALVFALSPGTTGAYLFDVVDGRFRFVASSRVPNLPRPESSVADSAVAAAAEIEGITGRVLFDRGEPISPRRSDGSGVGVLAAVCAPGGSLRVAVIGEDASLTNDSAPRAVIGGGHEIVFSLSLDSREVQRTDALYAAIRELRRVNPDVVLLAFSAAPQSGARLERVAYALGAADPTPGTQPYVVLYSGSDQFLAVARDGLGPRYPVRHCEPLRPGGGLESLEPTRAALAALHVEKWCERLPDFDYLASWLADAPVPRDTALGHAVRFLHESEKAPVYLVDFDRTSPGIFVMGPQGYSSYRLASAAVSIDDVMDWLQADLDAETVSAMLTNLCLRPAASPTSASEVLCQAAFFRAASRKVFTDARRPVVRPALSSSLLQLVGTGPDAGSFGDAAEAALLLLDCVQPEGVGHLRWDALSLLAPLGAVAERAPDLAAGVLLADAARAFAAFVAPAGAARPGSTAVQLSATLDDQTSFRVEVPFGAVESVPASAGDVATVAIQPVGQANVGAGPGAGMRLSVEGLPLGLIVDARGRPLSVAGTPAERREAMASQRLAIGCWADEGVVT